MHLQSINPSADPVFVKQTYEPRELYVFSSMTYMKVVKLRDEKKKFQVNVAFWQVVIEIC